MNERQTIDDLLKRSLLYQALKAEYEEILRHKWYESERAGHDIGFDLAKIDWCFKHRSLWLRAWQQQHLPAL